MDIELLKEEISDDEGCVFETYRDHLGYMTFGIGHLVTINDPEFGEPIETPISEDRVHEAFLEDMEDVLEDCENLPINFYDLPEEAQHVLANMAFNLGAPRLRQFKKMLAAFEQHDWNQVAYEMEDSKWFNQVPNRAKRLQDRILNV